MRPIYNRCLKPNGVANTTNGSRSQIQNKIPQMLSWKTKITASERGGPHGKKKGLFHMTDITISPCVGTLWHGYAPEFKRRDTDSI